MSKKETSGWRLDEQAYYKNRTKLLKDVTSEEVADSPFVYARRQNITSALVRIDLFRKILDVQGSIVECGVHKGNSLFLFSHLSSILEPYNFNRKIIGFDTFEGFKSIDKKKDDNSVKESDFSDTSYGFLNKFVELESKNRAVSHLEKIKLIKGDATKTIPEFVEKNPQLIIAMLYLDFDLYKPTKIALEYFLPLIPKGGIVGLDELNYKKWVGETTALKETVSIGSVSLKKFHYSPWESYFIVE